MHACAYIIILAASNAATALMPLDYIVAGYNSDCCYYYYYYCYYCYYYYYFDFERAALVDL